MADVGDQSPAPLSPQDVQNEPILPLLPVNPVAGRFVDALVFSPRLCPTG